LKVTFKAFIKKLEVKSLVSLDKGARLIIDFSGENPELINKINRLMRADEEIAVILNNEDDRNENRIKSRI
jgi:hypothetical protein